MQTIIKYENKNRYLKQKSIVALLTSVQDMGRKSIEGLDSACCLIILSGSDRTQDKVGIDLDGLHNSSIS